MKRLNIFALVILLALGLAWQATPALGQSEVVYLTQSGTAGNGDGTRLFQVAFDETTNRANLTLLYTMAAPAFDQVDALACTPDGLKVYAIDKTTANIGYYEPGTDSFINMDMQVRLGSGTLVPDIVLAAFNPTGTLYVASQSTNHLYSVNTSTGEAADLGYIGVSLQGADLAFDFFGNLYVYTNSTQKLYQVTQGTPNVATEVVSLPGAYFTGLAIRANGIGPFLGSRNTNPGTIVEFASTGLVRTYQMYYNGSPYNYLYGDMSVGPLRICTRTIGYWKNHSWDGRTVTICGQTYDEESGKALLADANGKTWSMFYAQLIAAKLNTDNVSGIQLIDDAEAYLCTYGSAPEVAFTREQKKDGTKSIAAGYWTDLDNFNNTYECGNN